MTEPDVALTDFALAAECALLAVLDLVFRGAPAALPALASGEPAQSRRL